MKEGLAIIGVPYGDVGRVGVCVERDLVSGGRRACRVVRGCERVLRDGCVSVARSVAADYLL